MENETNQSTQVTIASWDEVGRKGESRFFKVEADKSYRLRIAKVELVRKAFKEGDKPKLKACIHLSSVNGSQTDQVWETGSFQVINELKKHVVGNEWKGANCEYLMKKKKEGDKTTFIFEEIGGAVEALV